MNIEKRTIEHMSTGKALLLWMLKMNRKEVEFERINDDNIKLSTEIITNEVFARVAMWRVFLYKYFPMFLISCAFLIDLNFDSGFNRDGYSNILVSVFTILTALSMAILFYDNTQTRNVEKKILLFIFIIGLAVASYYLNLYIEYMMSMHLCPAFLITMILSKDFIEESWKNTYYSQSVGAIICYKNDKKASFIRVVAISFAMVTLMLLIVN